MSTKRQSKRQEQDERRRAKITQRLQRALLDVKCAELDLKPRDADRKIRTEMKDCFESVTWNLCRLIDASKLL